MDAGTVKGATVRRLKSYTSWVKVFSPNIAWACFLNIWRNIKDKSLFNNDFEWKLTENGEG
jgi:hypothetical protein